MSKGKIATIVIAVFAAISLIVVGGCAYLTAHSAEIHKTVGTVLDLAYTNGGAELVSKRIDQMVTDGKLTEEQAAKLKAAAQKSYDDFQKKLTELSVEDIEVQDQTDTATK